MQLTEMQNELTEETVRRLMKEVLDPSTRSARVVAHFKEATVRLRGLIREAQSEKVEVGEELYKLILQAEALATTMEARILQANKAPNGALHAV